MKKFDKKTKELYLRPNDKSGGIKLKDEDHYHEYDKDRKFIKDAKKKGIKKAMGKHEMSDAESNKIERRKQRIWGQGKI